MVLDGEIKRVNESEQESPGQRERDKEPPGQRRTVQH